MANLVPMAGLGSRFSRGDYCLPKPLIPVSGVPMVIQAVRSMPSSDKWVFIVRAEHVRRFRIDEVIRSEVPGAIIVEVDGSTQGQACTCMLGLSHIRPDESLFIGACDSGYLYNAPEYERLRMCDSVDCVVWTFTQREMLSRRPGAWGWCRLANDGRTVSDVSIKSPLSDDPRRDHAIVGSFYFKRSDDFRSAVDAMVAANRRVNGEFYVDALPVFLGRLGKRSVIFDVDLFVCWGSPQDLREYQSLEKAFAGAGSSEGLSQEDRLLGGMWREFFSRAGV